MGRLIIDGNSVYEIDEECERRKMQVQKEELMQSRDHRHRKQNERKNEKRR